MLPLILRVANLSQEALEVETSDRTILPLQAEGQIS